jgi:hypothetical protein
VDGSNWHGGADLDRLAFQLGLGDWADPKWIGKTVHVAGDADRKPLSVKIVKAFPRAVREIPHLDIRLRDGTGIAARMWLPEDADRSPVPVILEYLPYRKGDGTAIEDATRHRYFAGHGFGAIRVDMRGSGDSEGLLVDEYSQTELDDAVELIGWARVATVVQRSRRHDGHLVGRLQFAAGGRTRATGAACGHQRLFHRRSL